MNCAYAIDVGHLEQLYIDNQIKIPPPCTALLPVILNSEVLLYLEMADRKVKEYLAVLMESRAYSVEDDLCNNSKVFLHHYLHFFVFETFLAHLDIFFVHFKFMFKPFINFGLEHGICVLILTVL